MTRTKLLMLGICVAFLAVFAAPAAAQDGPAITVEPATVDAAGDYEFTITGTGWTVAPPIFVLPCVAPASGDIADLDADTCDTAALTPATPADGSFEVTATYTVGETGLAIAATDAGQVETAAALVTVGAAGGDDDTTTEEEGSETTTEEGGEEEELANTGVESGLLAIIGIAIVGAGAMAIGYTRRFA